MSKSYWPTIYTVFPKDPDEMPQDFDTYEEAQLYGIEKFGHGNFIIASPLS